MPIPKCKQLELSKDAKERLSKLIQDDWSQDSADLERRNKALTRWYKLWRAAMDPNGFPEQERPNFNVPLIPWQIRAKLSKEMDALLGEESEIMVNPVGESDVRRVPKVKKWMNWRIKQSLKLYKKLYVYLLQKRIFGTTIGCLEWKTKHRTIKELVPDMQEMEKLDPNGSGLLISVREPTGQMLERDKEVVDFDGPEMTVENLEDWVFPVSSTSADTVEDLDHFIRRLRLSVDDILELRDQGKLEKKILTKDLIEELRRRASTGHTGQDTETSETLTQEKDAQSGLPEVSQGREEQLEVLNWCGHFLLDKDKDERTQEIAAFWLKEKNLLLGVCRKVDIFPDGRWPYIVSQAMLDVNSILGQGDAEILEPLSNELDAIQNLAISAGEGASGPVVFYSPTSGWMPEKQRLESYTAIPCADPNSVKVVNLGQVNLGPFVLLMQQFLGFSERLTGITEAQLGRQFDRPNAPRTFGQQALLQGESNVLLLLDIRLERESLRELLNRVWEMDKRWLPKPVFFRVTEEDPGDVMTAEDMMGNYDFDIGPVTALSNRQIKQQEMLQALALAQAYPPAYLALLKKIIRKIDPEIAAIIPDAAAMQPPQTPKQEEARLLQGEELNVHPFDNHAEHIASHQNLIQRIEASEISPGVPLAAMNPEAIPRLLRHIAKHQQAMKAGPLSQLGAPNQPGQGSGNGAGAPQAMNPLASILQGLMAGQSPQEQANSNIASQVNQGTLNLR